MPVRGVGGDHPEPVLVELGHREVGFQRAAGVEPLGVGDPAGLAVHPVGGDLLQHPAGVAALHIELGHEGHVHQDHAGARGVVLGLPVAEPVLPAPGQPGLRRGAIWHGALRGVPVGALPAADVPEVRPLRHQPLVDRRHLRAARGPHRPARVVGLVHHAERLDGPGRAVLGVGLVAVQPVDVHGRSRRRRAGRRRSSARSPGRSRRRSGSRSSSARRPRSSSAAPAPRRRSAAGPG